MPDILTPDPTRGEQSDVRRSFVTSTQALNERAVDRRIVEAGADPLARPPIDPRLLVEEARQETQRIAETMQEVQQDYRALMNRDPAAQPVANDPQYRGEHEPQAAVTGGAEPSRGPEQIGNALKAGENAAGCMDDKTETDLVEYVKCCFDMSYDQISQRYDFWAEAETAHDVYVPSYVADKSAQSNTSRVRRNRPRIVDVIKVPYSRAISDTICTYNLAIFAGMPPFRVEPAGRKGSRKAAKIIEARLAQNMRAIGYEAKLYQMSLDQNRYGMSPFGIFFGEHGNALFNFDPWGYFPDPRVTAQNRDDSEFIGTRTWASMSALKRRGIFKCLDKLTNSTQPSSGWKCNRETRDAIRGQSIDYVKSQGRSETYKWGLGRAHVLNVLFAWLDPMQFKIPAPFGLYRIVVADEKHIILFDRTPFPHGKIPVLHGDAMFDAHKTFGSGTYDLLMPLQRFQDWLLRTRVENVQSIVQARVIADPSRVNIRDILYPNAARLVRTLPGANPKDALLPVEIQDATSRYWNDLITTGELMQRLSAANDTAQGVQTDTTKTATEIARITALGQQRLGTQARLLSAMTIRPAVWMMIKNLQYFEVDGGTVQIAPEFITDTNSDGWLEYAHADTIGEYDYAIVDGTLPLSAKENTENLIRVIRVLAETGLAAEWDMRKFVERTVQSMGFEDIDEWKLSKGQAEERIGAMRQAMAAQTPTTQVVNDEQIARERAAGNVIPLAEFMQQTSAPAPVTA